MLKEAVPYDFGGIDVIDELTVAPPKRKDSKKSKEEEKPESTTPSTVSGPEEPSLTNVVTAAEDFIKVLATVSTSQSSTTTDSDKGETQSSEKKKRKNTGKKKKTTKKKKGKGKGRNRKQKAEASVRIEEGGAVSPSGSKTEKLALSNFISESHKHNQSTRNRYRVDDSEYELGRQDVPYNEVMKDEPVMDKESAPDTSQTAAQKKLAESDSDAMPTSTRTAVVYLHKEKRLRKSRRKKSKPQDTNITDNFSVISVPDIITTSPTAQPEKHSKVNDTERQPVLCAVSSPIVIPKVKKNRSKEREDREGREKRRKVSSVSPIVGANHKKSSADDLNTIPPIGAPTVPSAPTAERQVSHRLEVNEAKMTVHTAPNSSFSVLKRRWLTEKGLRSRRRKTVLPPSSENPLFHSSSKDLLLVPTSSAPNSLANTAGTSKHTDKPESHGEWRIISTEVPSISTNTHRHINRQRRKPGKKVVPAALSDGVSTPTQTEHSHRTFAARVSEVTAAEELSVHRSGKQDMTTTATPVISPIKLSIERANAQFIRKKRKKAALSVRRQ